MQRDQKVGLALGVLLIGAVAAFFFRNETEPNQRLPQLESAEAVNREIAEKRLTPYFQNTDDNSTEDSAGSASERQDQTETRAGERRLPRWDELKSSESDPFQADSTAPRIPAPAPDPIPPAAASTDSVARTVDKGTVTAPDELTAAAPPATEILHEVQRGETLSSIAGKYLGSQARYFELYEANKIQLRDANDLQVGMKLRIPPAGSPAIPKTGPVARTAPLQDSPSVTVPETPSNSAPVFVPASTSTTTEPTTPEVATPSVAEPKPEPVTESPKLKFAPAKRRPRATTSAP